MAALGFISHSSSAGSMSPAILEDDSQDISVSTVINEVLNESPGSRQLSEPELAHLAKTFVSHIKNYNSGKKDYEQLDMTTQLEGLKCIDFQGQRVLWLTSTQIGSGSECSVYRGMTLEGQICAIKQSRTAPQQWNRMAKLLGECSTSHNIVNLLNANDEFMVEEYAGDNLHDFLSIIGRKNAVLDAEAAGAVERAVERHARCIDQWNEGLLQGLADIHAQGIVHSDIKLENVLVGEDDVIKFTDFGYAVKGDTIHGGTKTYYAPEQISFLNKVVQYPDMDIRQLDHQDRIDIWSGMLVLAKMNRKNLSAPFLTRLREYETKQGEIAYNAERARRGINVVAFKLEMQTYADQNRQYIASLIKQRKQEKKNAEGLFSDLQPTTTIEKLLIRMSHFNPNTRISSADALELYRNEKAQH